MSATARFERSAIEAELKEGETAAARPEVEEGPGPGAAVETAPAPAVETPASPPAKGKKVVTYRGICVYCGEKIEISVERRDAVCFAFCNPECKARFDAEMNAALD